jgi:hypothetical protein
MSPRAFRRHEVQNMAKLFNQRAEKQKGHGQHHLWPMEGREKSLYRHELHLSASVHSKAKPTSIEFDDIFRLGLHPPPLDVQA